MFLLWLAILDESHAKVILAFCENKLNPGRQTFYFVRYSDSQISYALLLKTKYFKISGKIPF
jgi:hypothetical protein